LARGRIVELQSLPDGQFRFVIIADAPVGSASGAPSQAEPEPGLTMTFEGLGLTLDNRGKRGYLNGRDLNFTPREFDLVSCLAGHRGQVLSKEQLLEHVWGPGWDGNWQVVYAEVGRLREKLGTEGDAIVQTRRGFGYVFCDPPPAVRRP
jgi:DNA-binding response OmpR family regulator